jgi:uncharacterized RDD family membrane protein YckC
MQEQNPYGAPLAAVEISSSPSELRPGGRGERLGAAFIDGLIVGGVFWTLVYLSGFWQTYVGSVLSGDRAAWKLIVGMVVASFAAFVCIQAYPLANSGQTWGKRLLKLRIVDMQGFKPDFWRLIALRYGVGRVIAMVPMLGGIYSLVDVLFIFRDDRRCIHDHIAGTRVVVAD